MEPENKTPARNATPSVAGGQKPNVQTYAEDMAKVIEGNEGRMIKKIIH